MTSGAKLNSCCTGGTIPTSLQKNFPRKVRFLGVSELQVASTGVDGRRCGRPRVHASHATVSIHAGDSYDKPGKPNCLVVVLVRAKKLKRLEKYAETPGTTDPTCMLTLDGEKKRSRTVENQLNPHRLSAC